MLHYHGLPVTPRATLRGLAGRNLCVSYATAKGDVAVAHSLAQSVLLDNGAFSFWRSGVSTDWDGYYAWVEPWLRGYPTTWAIIPDIIEGSEEENDRLLAAWFQTRMPRGAPVWHCHESLERLARLCHAYPRVCIGSSAEYAKVGDRKWHHRMQAAMNYICRDGHPPCWLHMLRGMALSGSEYPFASVDSTDVARNHNRPQNDALEMAERWDGRQCPGGWKYHAQLEFAA